MKSKNMIYTLLSYFIIMHPAINTQAQVANHIRLTKNLKDSLKNKIEAMLVDDQRYRWMLEFGEIDEQKIETYKQMDEAAKFKRIKDVLDHKVGISNLQMDSLEKLQEAIDSVNFIQLKGIIIAYGFPHKYIPSYKPATILLHSPEKLMNDNFFNVLKEEISIGNMEAIEYARLFDKVQLERHLPELYFVNEHYDSTTKRTTIGTPKDLDITNRARKEIGLERYLK